MKQLLESKDKEIRDLIQALMSSEYELSDLFGTYQRKED